jgi:hypothetical protein
VLVAAGLTTAAAGAQAVSENRGIRYMYAAYAPCYLPSPHFPPLSLHGQPVPPDVTDNRVLWDLHAQCPHKSHGGGPGRGMLRLAWRIRVTRLIRGTGVPLINRIARIDHVTLHANPTKGAKGMRVATAAGWQWLGCGVRGLR